MASPRAQRTRTPLDRDRIVAAAIEFADTEGLEALSMRRLAKALGFEVMSLYNHVANKDDLIEAMVDAACAEVNPPIQDDWRADLRVTAIDLHKALREHRWATHHWPWAFPGPHRWRLAERLLTSLHGSGLSPDLADLGFHTIVNHVVGFSHLASGYAKAPPEDEGRARFAREVDIAAHPGLARHGDYHAGPRGAARPDEFEFVLDLILDQLDHEAPAADPRPDT
ncbi:MAG: TetR/AcrR family transcriptional regulator C-terminal domain-containing protein [Actinomycetia bacterium]|nr:TetR/AcrR family transcriptional regulator C-terminal domain-containing protein [Actinomycetes bacterium]